MSEEHARHSLITLPDGDVPSTLRCIRIMVPDSEGTQYLQQLAGAMRVLTLWSSYQRDPTHKAKDVAYIWKLATLELFRSCGLIDDVRQNTENPCQLEKEIDGDWTVFADLQLCPPHVRIDKGIIQFWDGSAWVSLPGAGDERVDGTYTPPWPDGTVPSGQTAQCLSAENVLSVFTTEMERLKAGLEAGKAAVELAVVVTSVLSLFIELALIADIALVLVGVAIASGVGTLDDLLTDANLKKIRCALYNHCQDNGSYTAENFTDIMAELDSEFSGAEATILDHYFEMLGPVGLSRQGAAAGIASADCSDCAGIELRFPHWGTASDNPVEVSMIVTLSSTPRGGCHTIDMIIGPDDSKWHFEILSKTGFSSNSCGFDDFTVGYIAGSSFSHPADIVGSWDCLNYLSVNSNSPFTLSFEIILGPAC